MPAGAFWDVASWFPDGTQLLANAFEPGGHRSIWVVTMLGQSPRELREGVMAMEVSRDRTRIAFGPFVEPGYREIWVMGRQGDNPQKVLALGENEWLGAVHCSPDGQRLAYVKGAGLTQPLLAIETCDLKGASRTVVVSADPLVTGQQDAVTPRLSPDGAWILYREVPKTAIGPSTPLRLMRVPVS